jgi:hypothetical protein
MSIPVADDFAEIARRLREIAQEKDNSQPKASDAEAPQISPAEQESTYYGMGYYSDGSM